MKSATSLIFLAAVYVSAVMATNHTTCYNYFLNKDKCVSAAASPNTRCPAPTKSHDAPVKQFVLDPKKGKGKKGKKGKKDRRYDNPKPSFSIDGGDGICGHYDTSTEIGVCLWSGAEQNNPTVETAGWLNGLKTSNCGKRVYIQRKGRPDTVQYAKVLDGCSFDETSSWPGCFEIAITTKLFELFRPTKKERDAGYILGGFTWDFDAQNGTSLTQSPV
ncbi:hypothetical protein PTTG_04712 [Puccinia triticina 1-1 BBBD Race 1]|uniref:Secreted protein n=1 Tax=Puccinia triticina (isolate 1-1 / race 1 (BBBD)) TaxID=630390 RepID=A0A180GEV9_PUCT1|nr:hypothetical protein PTTG_04712 [Puccinia triticina 1-1 BBBD Race 1]WAR51941.1 hypothetical protein PtB15_1B378 [Puccinia triticina]